MVLSLYRRACRCSIPALLLLSRLVAYAVAEHVENFNSRTDPPGSTALVPYPSEEYLKREKEKPYLSPLPNDILQAPQKWPNCAWQVATEPSSSSFGYLDLNAYYHTLVIWEFEDDDVYRFTGRFPLMRYMSYQSYVFTSGKPITSLLDAHIKPSWGKNPYSDPSATPEERGGYEIYMTANGSYGYDNELRAKRDGQESKVVTVILRFYDMDPSAKSLNSTRFQQFWGFADPPKVEHLVKKKATSFFLRKHEEQPRSWEEFPRCSDFGAALFQSTFTDSYPTLSKLPPGKASCPMARLTDQLFPSMVLFGAGLEQGYAAKITSYTNYDTNYLYWCALEKVVSSNVVMRVQGKLPTTPHSLYGSPRVSDTAAYDMRYLSISTIDMLFPSPTYEEVKDHDIEHFYSAVPDWDRTFSIVMAVNRTIASRCNLYDPDSQIFLAFQDGYNYGLKPTRMPSIIYRELLSNRRGKTLADLRPLCEAAGKCGDGEFIRGVMQEFYPQLDVWRCDPDTGVPVVLA